MKKNTPQDFWKRVDIRSDNECWLWLGAKSRRGYGNISIAGKHHKSHRLAYELSYGTFPDGLEICHTCDNPPCCNPSHLFAGTHSDNMQDMASKGRHIYPVKPRRAHLLNESQKQQIFAMWQRGLTNAKIGETFSINRKDVADVIESILAD